MYVCALFASSSDSKISAIVSFIFRVFLFPRLFFATGYFALRIAAQ